ncbi:hypothetical protein C7377_1547 [Balneicella halophila]|uniref:Helix-turn-helix protein n=1 Tax=Balneicella halophila TaxID=1537566 RepID=A0A7L4UMZ8_BALHA|nr:helix-turn-helix transcriptional regulator [Balneicella halophila]PVX49909.1 hypothetical protein C7377_1547 [Balneicella halophila]
MEQEDKDVLDSITERIFQFIDAEGLSNADFAASIDIGAAVVSHMKNGRNKVSLNVYAKILDSFPNLNPDWLLFGEGIMYRSVNKLKSGNPITDEPNLFNTIRKQESNEVETDREKTSSAPPVTSKRVQKIVVFYDDNTFQEFSS